jgi:HSP20 family protein
MSTLFHERTPFDILFKNFFNAEGTFQPTTFDSKQPHPLDIFYDNDGLNFEIACTGLTKKDIKLVIDGDILNISYDKPSGEESYEGYIYKGLAKRSFKLGYKVAAKFDLSKIEAKMENGLLHLFIPVAENKKSKLITIK